MHTYIKRAIRGLQAAAFLTAPVAMAGTSGFNTPGNVLITDQFNNRVIEVSPQGQIVWTFGSGNPNLCNPGPGSVIAPNDAERLANGLTLIAGTGTGDCPDNRVIVVDQSGNIVFQYGQAGVSGSGPNELNTPVFAIQLPSGGYLITDQGNNRVIGVDTSGRHVYTYGPRHHPGKLNSPNSAELLPDGNLLLADENNNRFLTIDPLTRTVLSQDHKHLSVVAFASLLPDGNTLVADSGHNRIVEINPEKMVVFSYNTSNAMNSNPNPNPTGALRLANGNTIIADQFNDRAIIITPNKKVVFQYGTTNVVGNGPNQLNAPYSAVIIGDYTGVTPPPGL
jgi:hypothetical protein